MDAAVFHGEVGMRPMRVTVRTIQILPMPTLEALALSGEDPAW